MEPPVLKEFRPSLTLGVCFVQGMKSSALRGKAVRTPHKHTNLQNKEFVHGPAQEVQITSWAYFGKTVAESGHIKPVKHGVSALFTSLYVPAEQAVGSLMPSMILTP